MPKYPDVKVKLVGEDGNAFLILARISSAMKKHKVPADQIRLFFDEAKSGDYDNLLRTCMEWVDVQ